MVVEVLFQEQGLPTLQVVLASSMVIAHGTPATICINSTWAHGFDSNSAGFANIVKMQMSRST
jgi:hypothetical protein